MVRDIWEMLTNLAPQSLRGAPSWAPWSPELFRPALLWQAMIAAGGLGWSHGCEQTYVLPTAQSWEGRGDDWDQNKVVSDLRLRDPETMSLQAWQALRA